MPWIKARSGIIGALALATPGVAGAVANPHEVFVGSYSLQVETDYQTFEFPGLQLGYAYDFTEHFGFRGSLYSLENDTFANWEVAGVDLSVVGGLLGPGFNIFAGGGLFSEEHELSGYSERFSGGQITLGIGYSWEHVQLSLVAKGRQASGYEDSLNDLNGFQTNVTAGSGALNVGYRF